jgi:predicted transcriptional regulator
MKEDLSYQVTLIERVKKELGMSQSDIARKFEIGESAVSEWVSKKRKMKAPPKIALELMLKNNEQQKRLKIVDSFTELVSENIRNQAKIL